MIVDHMRTMDMGKFMKACRMNAGLTQEQLAGKMGVSVVSVQNWESGNNDRESSLYGIGGCI